MRAFSTVSTLALFGVLASLVEAQRPIPEGLKQLRDQIKAGKCQNVIKDGLKAGEDGDQGEFSA